MEDEKLRNLKLGNYNTESNNFRIDEELMITITLNEYRELVTVKATKDLLVKQAESDRYTREAENKSLKEQNEKLKGENYDLLQKLQRFEMTSKDIGEDEKE
jgi:hypothetical protein